MLPSTGKTLPSCSSVCPVLRCQLLPEIFISIRVHPLLEELLSCKRVHADTLHRGRATPATDQHPQVPFSPGFRRPPAPWDHSPASCPEKLAPRGPLCVLRIVVDSIDSSFQERREP